MRGAASWKEKAEVEKSERLVKNGSYEIIQKACPLDGWYGHILLRGILEIDPKHLVCAGKDSSLSSFRPDRTLFFDLETTGLLSGGGTCAFLVGAAHIEGNNLVLRQYFLENLEAESDMLQEVYDYFREFSGVVTYNGKTFDLPLLRKRFILRGVADCFDADYHLDLLHAARRLWGSELPSCRLKEVEKSLLGLRRTGDAEGWEIPTLYFDYQRTGDREILHPVFRHNLLDVKSLVALTIMAAAVIDENLEGKCVRHRNSYKGACVADQLIRPEEAVIRIEAGVPALIGDHCYKALRRLSLILKRKKRWAEAEKVWLEMVEGYPEGSLAYHELAKLYEHRYRDLERAVEVVRGRLSMICSARSKTSGHFPSCREQKDLEKRLSRLTMKVAGNAG